MSILDHTAVKFENGELFFLDQTLLPNEEKYIEITGVDDACDAIGRLALRGAPAIGVGAAYALLMEAVKYCMGNDLLSQGTMTKAMTHDEVSDMYSHMRSSAERIVSVRPTAVNLKWAANRMMERLERSMDMSDEIDRGALGLIEMCGDYIVSELYEEANAIRQEDEDNCYMMGALGLTLLEPDMGILTHCNAGALATAGYGTALSPIHLGQERGYDFKVYADETRPLLQGARLTAWELAQSEVDVTLICDNMASTLMKQGRVDAVLVGCDRLAANGDGANKIGTSALAILAKEYGIPFYMFVPTSTVDMSAATGDDIVIEERDGDEICEMWYEKRMAPEGIRTYNPAFDVTDHSYITSIVTELGVIPPPYDVNLSILFNGTAPEGADSCDRN